MSDGSPLRIISLFEDLSDAELSTIAACCVIRTYEKQAQILDGEFFADVRPVATMVEVNALIDPDLLVEIEVDAYAPR